MNNRYIRAIASGIMIGTAAGMLLVPQLDRNTKKRIRRTGKMMRDTAEDMYDNMRGWMR